MAKILKEREGFCGDPRLWQTSSKDTLDSACKVHDDIYINPELQEKITRSESDELLELHSKALARSWFGRAKAWFYYRLARWKGKDLWEVEKTND